MAWPGLLIVHLALTAALAGLIWLVQLVHYPGFALVGPERFAAYEAFHTRSITPLVSLLMGAELLTAAAVLAAAPTLADRWWAGLGAALVAVVWLHTALVAVPLHGQLAGGFDAELAQRLVRTNWVRTLAWTARAGVAALLLWRAFTSAA